MLVARALVNLAGLGRITCPRVVTLEQWCQRCVLNACGHVWTYSNMLRPAPTVLFRQLLQPQIGSAVLTQQIAELDGLLLELRRRGHGRTHSLGISCQ
jgi:hypothetical protein